MNRDPISQTPPKRHYRCLPRRIVSQGDFALTTVQDEHIEPIRQWRNAQLDVLRQKAPITPEQQVQYFSRIWPTMEDRHPANILLIFLNRGHAIGYGGLVHIAWQDRRAEVSFLLDPERTQNPVAYQRYFSVFLGLLKELAFKQLGLYRLFTETFDFRSDHMKALEANGFQLEGRLRGHVDVNGVRHDSLIHGVLRDDE